MGKRKVKSSESSQILTNNNQKTLEELKVEEKIKSLLKNAPLFAVAENDSNNQPSTSNFNFMAKMGYLSHDYWPSLLCISENKNYIRFFNLTNTRNQGTFRYYRCSKCTSLKTTASSAANMIALNSALSELDKNDKSHSLIDSSLGDLPSQFSAPKIQVNGMDIVTDFYNLIHHSECRPIPIPAMIADQLDRRARRQVSLGLLEPRDAWSQAYFEAIRISEKVSNAHPGLNTVAEFFPSYEMARVQYSRHFHKNKRRLSQISNDNLNNLQQKKCFTNFFLSKSECSKIGTNQNLLNLKKKLNKNNFTQNINNSNELRRSKRKQLFNKGLENEVSNNSNFDKHSFIVNNKINCQFDLQTDKNTNLKTNKIFVENNYKKIEQNNLMEDQNFSTSDYLIVDGYFDSGDGADMILADKYQETLFSSDSLKMNTGFNDLCNINYFDNFSGYKNFNYEKIIVDGNEEIIEDELITVDNQNTLITFIV